MADTMEGGVGGAIREMESALEELMIVLGNIIVVGVTPLIKISLIWQTGSRNSLLQFNRPS